MPIYTFDTEFLEDGSTIELISIGIVCEDGREYYAVNSEMPVERIAKDDWLMTHVVPSLPRHDPRPPRRLDGSHGPWIWSGPYLRSTEVKPKWVIANEVRDFLRADGSPELWADYAAYDHVALAQLWGKMVHLPKGIPMVTYDIEQEIRRAPGFVKPEQAEGEHNALADARHNLVVLRALGIVKAGA